VHRLTSCVGEFGFTQHPKAAAFTVLAAFVFVILPVNHF
jgi:hypothetical protein